LSALQLHPRKSSACTNCAKAKVSCVEVDYRQEEHTEVEAKARAARRKTKKEEDMEWQREIRDILISMLGAMCRREGALTRIAGCMEREEQRRSGRKGKEQAVIEVDMEKETEETEKVRETTEEDTEAEEESDELEDDRMEVVEDEMESDETPTPSIFSVGGSLE